MEIVISKIKHPIIRRIIKEKDGTVVVHRTPFSSQGRRVKSGLPICLFRIRLEIAKEIRNTLVSSKLSPTARRKGLYISCHFQIIGFLIKFEV